MQALKFIFLGIMLYGLFTSKVGAFLFAFGIFWLVVYADYKFRKDDVAWYLRPRDKPSTLDDLSNKQQESGRDIL